VVEHSLGKGEVESSILSGSTSVYNASTAPEESSLLFRWTRGRNDPLWAPRPSRGDHDRHSAVAGMWIAGWKAW